MSSGLIDVHAHLLPDFYVQQATAAGHAHPDGMGGWPTWSVRTHLDLMDRNGIDTAMLSMSSPGVHFGDDNAARLLARRVNEYTAELTRDHPGRFGNFVSLPLPDVDGSLEEIAFAFDELDADGVALLTHAHGVYLGDQRLDPVFVELDRRRAVVFLHPTSPVCWEQSALGRPRPMVEYIFDTARTVTDLVMAGVLTRHPNMQVIVPHGGGAVPVLADRINEFMRLFLPSGKSPSSMPSSNYRACTTTWRAQPFHARSPHCSNSSVRTACCSAATTAGRLPRWPMPTSRRSTRPSHRLRGPRGVP